MSASVLLHQIRRNQTRLYRDLEVEVLVNKIDSRIAEAAEAAGHQLEPMTAEEIRSLNFNAADYRAKEHMFYRMLQETAAQLADFNRKFAEVFPRLKEADQGSHPGKD